VEVHVALDIYRGMVVRMTKGDLRDMTIYSRNPVEKGLEILNAGIKRIHIVDLEAAIEGKPIGYPALEVAKKLKEVGGFVTVAGGIRRASDLEAALGTGADRVVIGTAIYRGDLAVEDVLRLGRERVVLACDIRGYHVVHSGWRASTGLEIRDILRRYFEAGFRLFLVTMVERDGTMGGLDLKALSMIPEIYRGYIIYSGGVSSKRDLEVLRGEGFRGAVVGRAYYEGLLSPQDIASMEGI
jgi:Phosphoribosylformimino-5-aminoimidazole carboxamide ribonucleotide (ProFAR) isomerase